MKSFIPVPVMLVAAAILPAGFGLTHLHLTKSEPEAKAVLTAPPAQIRLWFSETPEASLTTITLYRPDSTKVPVEAVKSVDDSSVAAAVTAAPTPPGDYIVLWKTSAQDGHVVRGRFEFTLAKDSTAGSPGQ